MKVLVRKIDAVAIQAYDDTENVAQDRRKALDPVGARGFLGTDGAVIYTGVTVPADFKPAKYCFDGSAFTPNPHYRTREEKLAKPADADKLAEYLQLPAAARE